MVLVLSLKTDKAVSFLLSLSRVRSYLFYGWPDNLIDPDGGSNGVTQDQSLSTAGEPGDVVWPADGWCDIRQAWKSPQEVLCFTNGRILYSP